MVKPEWPMTDEIWHAIIRNDASYDDQFIYAVQSTGIFCRPSCKSRAPKKEHIRIFGSPAEAIAANFRPCKRCKPAHGRMPDDEWVEQITDYIDAHFREKLTLDILADVCHGSPYHLQRTFKRIKGVTPALYIQQRRISKAAEYLERTDKAIAEIAERVGLGSTAYFITLFKKTTGQTPAEYRGKKAAVLQSEVDLHEIDN
ncbi:bifunctional transcriptional activator/DNA repair enzyme AdaA [Paenibacillus ihumii]|uniref:bifunctional transcriptional activator/DNA repair enzyme AdaA n=1 Tax=Paenibacillus ihumii TaxID=687436 RepID=UPI0006D7695D|nr:bifunctional transcriptional activator/DNA repair enzyme AdaA [Paenibacillus ihumii]